MRRNFWFYVKEVLGVLIGIPAVLVIAAILLCLSPLILLVWLLYPSR